MLIQSLQIKNLLSFGPTSEPLPLARLNVLIGPNGSGKSNFLEALSLLQAAPKDLSAPVKEVGGVRDWLWKGTANAVASLEVMIDNPRGRMPLRHLLRFTEHGSRFELVEERIENERAFPGSSVPYFFYRFQNGYPVLKERPGDDTRSIKQSTPHAQEAGEERELKRETLNPEQSILSQVKDPERYPVLAHLESSYSRISIYREWSFGRYTPPRQEQKADLRTDLLMATCENLALVLNKIRPKGRKRLLEALKALYPEIQDFNVQVEAGRVQLFLEEGNYSIPATRLSDGTLRYLCLLAILCHPEPSPVVCVEEPELGLHPDVLPELARLLVEASERTQLIVTTHSDILVDAMTERPESVVVCEKHDGQTGMRRLKKDELAAWLDKYRLGQLWTKGQIGGTRW
ncbi:MAG: AAA family ATPase [Verrucomicrobia bacterium]|nr:AAA family ATPase [Verrucomicrobiota bacterium]